MEVKGLIYRCKERVTWRKSQVKGLTEMDLWRVTTKKVVRKLRKNSCPLQREGEGGLTQASPDNEHPDIYLYL